MLRTFLALVFLASTCHAGLLDLDGHDIDDFYFNIEGRAGFAWLSGEASADGDFFDGDDIDFTDMGIDEDDWLLELAGTFRIKKQFQIRARGFAKSWEGDESVEATFEFDDVQFTVTDDVEARLSVTALAADFEWLFLTKGDAKKLSFELGFGGGLRYIYARLWIENETTGFNGSGRVPAATLTAGLFAGLTIANCLRIEASAAGFAFDYGSVELVYLEATLEAKLYLNRYFYFCAGAWVTDLNIERSGRVDFEIDLTLVSGFVGVGVQF